MAESDPHNNPELSIAEIRAACANHPNSIRLQDLHKHADADQEYQQIQHYVCNGFPHHRHQLPERCRRYWNIRSQLALDDDLIVFGCRLLIPTTMHSQILHELHASHQGAVRTKQRAKLIVYWPGINNDIDNTILSCKQCQDSLPSHSKEPIIMKPTPSRPFQDSQSTSAHMRGTTSSSSSTATPIGPTSFTWAITPPPLTSPLPSSKPSAAQEHQTLSGQTKGPNSHPSCSRISPENGDFSTSLPPQCTHKATGRLRPQSNQ